MTQSGDSAQSQRLFGKLVSFNVATDCGVIDAGFRALLSDIVDSEIVARLPREPHRMERTTRICLYPFWVEFEAGPTLRGRRYAVQITRLKTTIQPPAAAPDDDWRDYTPGWMRDGDWRERDPRQSGQSL